MPTQPWVSVRNPFGYLWLNEVRRMLEAGALNEAQIQSEIDLGFFRPSIKIELADGPISGPDDTRLTALEEFDRDAGFIAHRSVAEFEHKRQLAIAAYEQALSWKQGPLHFARYISGRWLRAGRVKAGLIKRLVLH